MSENFAERLKNEIEIQGLKKNYIANKIGIDASYLTHLCNGTYMPAKKTIILLSDALGVSCEWLEHGTGDKKPTSVKTEDTSEYAVIMSMRELPPEKKKKISRVYQLLAQQELDEEKK